ncbi:MAG: rod shape-determining protein MreC [Sneathiellaceae bacterium]
MRIRETKVMHHAMPLRAWGHRLAFGLFVFAAIALIILSRIDQSLSDRLRQSVLDIFAPAITVVQEPVGAFNQAVAEVRALIALRDQNLALLESNRRLQHWRDTALQLEHENSQLRDLLLTSKEPLQNFVTARAIGDPGGPFVRTLILRTGVEAGIDKGDPVLGDNGLIGRVITVGRTSSRVLLLTDLNSRVPVLIADSRIRGILTGDNTAQPRIAFLPQSAEIGEGERVITSGDGGLFPQGLTVGRVVRLEDGGIRVALSTDIARQEFLRVMKYTPLAVDPVPQPDLSGPMRMLAPLWAAAKDAPPTAQSCTGATLGTGGEGVPLPMQRPEDAARQAAAR